MSRLQTGTGTWSEGYQYSNVGNMWYGARSGLPTLTQESPQGPAWFLANNQINGWGTGASGNVESQGGLARSFVYDAENRQISATVNGAVSTYVYDGEGQRVQKIAGGVTTTYIYDVSGELAAEYVSEPVPALCSTALCYVTADHLGSARMVTDAGGNVDRRYDYTPFGTELLAGTGGRTTGMGYRTVPDGFGPKFTGQMWDVETGLYYFNARYYSPAQGRFTGVDPENAGAVIGDSQSWHGYAYVGNSPLSRTDPTGRSWQRWVGVGLTIGGALLGVPGVGNALGLTLGTAATASKVLVTAGGVLAGRGGGLGFGVDTFTGCGGPLSGCGGIGGGGWNERSPIGPSVQDPGRFIFSGKKICGDLYCDENGRPNFNDPLPADMMDASDPGANLILPRVASAGVRVTAGVGSAVGRAATRVAARYGLSPGFMGFAVGNLGPSLHVAYRVNGVWMHWVGAGTNWTAMAGRGAEGFAMRNAFFKFYLPILFSNRAAATCGMPATSCANAAWTALKWGWGR